MGNNVFYGIDFGGSNLRIGKVDPETGDLIGQVFSKSLEDVVSNEQLMDIILPQIEESNSNIGISAAGNVDEKSAILKVSANSRIREEITFGKTLRDLGHNVVMTNDMKAAVQGAARYGEGRGYENVLLVTFSSGNNCAVVRNGQNASQAEFGHMKYGKDAELYCGCGAKGHLEPYVSGNGAAAMAKQFFDITHETNHLIIEFALHDLNKKRGTVLTFSDLQSNMDQYALVRESINAKHVYQAYSANPEKEPQNSIKRETQMNAIADSFGMMVSAFNPIDMIVLMGSQTKDWATLFEPAMLLYSEGGLQLRSLSYPKIVRTQLPEIGVQGAVGYFLSVKN